jgi:hypothetical protein
MATELKDLTVELDEIIQQLEKKLEPAPAK